MKQVLIIGAGLSGLLTAYRLKQKNIKFQVLESQNRAGGRIHTTYGQLGTPMEMGATWFGSQHTALVALLEELQLAHFEQHAEGLALFETMSFEPPQQFFIPAADAPYYRIAGGSAQLINTLVKAIGEDSIRLNTIVKSIVDQGDTVLVTAADGQTYSGTQLVIAMPPRLVADKIQFQPALPSDWQAVASSVQTWMSGSVKFAVEYARPFWREAGFSGTIFSQSRMATEVYDHSNADGTRFALKGFLNGSAYQYTQVERQAIIIDQLTHYFGAVARDFLHYEDKIWNDAHLQSGNESFLPPHHFNGHPALLVPYGDGKIFFSGTETSPAFGGYMDGAVRAAEATVARLLSAV
jgi:monoamine oxidase